MAKKVFCIVGALLALAVFAAAPVQAGFVLTLDDLSTGGIDVTVTDDGAGDSFAGLGKITYIGVVGLGTFSVNVTTGLSKPVLSPEAQMDLNSVNVSTTGAGTLDIFLTDTGFSPATAGDLVLLVGGTLIAPAGSTAKFLAGKDKDNLEFGTPEVLSPILGPFGPGAFAASSSTPHGPFGAAYSMTLASRVIFTGKGTVSYDFYARNIVPEPATLSLLGLGVLGLMGFVRRRKAA